MPRSAQGQLNMAQAEEVKLGNETPEYTVDKLTRHVSTGDNFRNVVR